MPRPDLSRIPTFYHGYISKVKEDDLMEAMKNTTENALVLFSSIPAEKYEYRYAEDKWTVKELIQHMIDADRVFIYRAMCFARKDTVNLPGFNEDNYAKYSKANDRKWEDIITEFTYLRKGNEAMFASFDEEQLNAEGIANSNPVYVMGIGYISAGHINHHCDIIKEKYL